MLGGIETPRLNVTRVPPCSSPEAWGHYFAELEALANAWVRTEDIYSLRAENQVSFTQHFEFNPSFQRQRIHRQTILPQTETQPQFAG